MRAWVWRPPENRHVSGDAQPDETRDEQRRLAIRELGNTSELGQAALAVIAARDAHDAGALELRKWLDVATRNAQRLMASPDDALVRAELEAVNLMLAAAAAQVARGSTPATTEHVQGFGRLVDEHAPELAATWLAPYRQSPRGRADCVARIRRPRPRAPRLRRRKRRTSRATRAGPDDGPDEPPHGVARHRWRFRALRPRRRWCS